MSSEWTDEFMPRAGARSTSRSWVPPNRPRLSGAIVTLVVIVVLGVLAVPVSSLARGGKSFWPEQWDARIASIAQRDEKLRTLDYEHPVAVRFLPEQAFKKLVGGNDGLGVAGRAEISRQAATFRALGLIGGKVDLFETTKQVGEAGILAFYDYHEKEIVVRGTTLDLSHRATLAHELIHVLQDQQFDLRKIEQRASEDEERRGGSAQAVLALIEGDANSVEDRYLKGLSPAQRSQYDREQRAQASDVGKAIVGVPPVIELLFSAPYSLGPLTIRMLRADGGNAAVNAALTGPTPTSAAFVQAGLIAPPPSNLLVPTLASGERAEGRPEAFGAFELYLVLAARDDPVTALTAADSVLGGRALGLRRNGKYCYRAVLATRSAAAATFVAGSVRRWSASATGASVSRTGSNVTFTACDPGAKAVGPSRERVQSAGFLLGGRSGIAVGAAEEGVPAVVARCVARLFALSPGAVALLEQAGRGSFSPDAAQRARELVKQAALTCREDPLGGLL